HSHLWRKVAKLHYPSSDWGRFRHPSHGPQDMPVVGGVDLQLMHSRDQKKVARVDGTLPRLPDVYSVAADDAAIHAKRAYEKEKAPSSNRNRPLKKAATLSCELLRS